MSSTSASSTTFSDKKSPDYVPPRYKILDLLVEAIQSWPDGTEWEYDPLELAEHLLARIERRAIAKVGNRILFSEMAMPAGHVYCDEVLEAAQNQMAKG